MSPERSVGLQVASEDLPAALSEIYTVQSQETRSEAVAQNGASQTVSAAADASLTSLMAQNAPPWMSPERSAGLQVASEDLPCGKHTSHVAQQLSSCTGSQSCSERNLHSPIAGKEV
eukprot:gene27584-34327_t